MKRTLKAWNGVEIGITIGAGYDINRGEFLDDEGDSRSASMGFWESDEEKGMTPAQRLGMEVGGVYRLNHKGNFYDSPFALVKLTRDDGSMVPRFEMLEGPSMGQHLWIGLDWIMRSPLTRKAAEVNISNEDNSRTEGDDTMTTQTAAQKAGLKIGDKVRLIEEDIDAEVGEVLTFRSDDNTTSPFFENAEGRPFPVMLRKVRKVEDEKGPKIEQVEVGGPVRLGDTVFTKDGRQSVIDSIAGGPDSDNEYSTQSGYENVDDIEMICRVVKPKPETKEVTIELTDADIDALRKAEAALIHHEIDDMYSSTHRKAWVSILERLYRAS